MKPLVSRLAGIRGAVRRLSWRDRIDVVHIVVALIIVEAWLRVGPLPPLARLLGVPLELRAVPTGTPMAQLPSERAARQIALTRAVVRRFHPGPACLRTSLVAGNRLRRLNPQLRVGVTRGPSKLSAHAWLEIDGEYFDPEAAAYQPTVMGGA